jgi:anti-sigma B factor antagonist
MTLAEMGFVAEPLPFHIVVVEDRFFRNPLDPTVIVVIGELDLATASRAEDAVLGQLHAGRTDLVIDMAGVEFIDCVGTRALLRCGEQVRSAGGQLRLRSPSRCVRRLLDLLHLGEALPKTT